MAPATLNQLRYRAAHVIFAWLLASACGNNLLAPVEQRDPVDQAIAALEAGRSNEAIDILESALADEPNNPQFKSLLAMAYAQRAGLDPIDYALGLASDAGGEDGDDTSSEPQNTNPITSTFDLMPAATAQNISDLNYAVTLLAEIPASERLEADYFKLALFQTAALTLTAKALDLNGDGQLSATEVLLLSDDAAEELLLSLVAATSVLASSPNQEGSVAAIASKLASVQSDIDSAQGSEDSDKVRNFLANNGS